jgi:DNA-binding IclR family transcriptional regulator
MNHTVPPHAGPSASASSMGARILALVREKPGIPLTVVMQAVGIHWAGLYHHVHRLQEEGFVRRSKQGRRCLLYPAGVGYADAPIDGLLLGPTTRRIAEALCEHEGLDVPELARRAGETPRVVYYHLERLVRANLVTSGSPTRYRGLRSTPALRVALVALRRREPASVTPRPATPPDASG